MNAGDGVDDVGQVGGHPAEDLGEREVRQGAVAEVEAAGEHLPALGERDVAQLGEQPGLADAGVAGQQHVGGGPVRLAGASPDAGRTPSNEAISVSSASRPTRVLLVCPATSPMISRAASLLIFRGSADDVAGARGLAYAGQPAVPLPAAREGGLDPVPAVVELGLQVGVVVSYMWGLSSSLVIRDSLPEVAPHIGQVPYLGLRWVMGALGGPACNARYPTGAPPWGLHRPANGALQGPATDPHPGHQRDPRPVGQMHVGRRIEHHQVRPLPGTSTPTSSWSRARARRGGRVDGLGRGHPHLAHGQRDAQRAASW